LEIIEILNEVPRLLIYLGKLMKLVYEAKIDSKVIPLLPAPLAQKKRLFDDDQIYLSYYPKSYAALKGR